MLHSLVRPNTMTCALTTMPIRPAEPHQMTCVDLRKPHGLHRLYICYALRHRKQERLPHSVQTASLCRPQDVRRCHGLQGTRAPANSRPTTEAHHDLSVPTRFDGAHRAHLVAQPRHLALPEAERAVIGRDLGMLRGGCARHVPPRVVASKGCMLFAEGIYVARPKSSQTRN